MKKLLIAVSVAALAGAAALPALAQSGAAPAQAERGHRGPGGMLFQSDANSDGVVTRAEFDAGRAAHFTQLDANRDGSVTREERRASWQAMRGERGEHGRRGGRGHGMERADANNDGNITRDEFLAGPLERFARMDTNSDGIITVAERPQRPQRPERGERPARVNPDTNNDGSLSRAEFDAQGAAMFTRLDANSDGRVTREEADAHRGGRRGPPPAAQ